MKSILEMLEEAARKAWKIVPDKKPKANQRLLDDAIQNALFIMS